MRQSNSVEVVVY